jgi:hypothetical protein
MQGKPMRKIDTTAYNKRLHSEILELDKMLKQIKPEHINLFDAGLIKTADEYVRLISNANWADNSNFNGIEMHKVKDMLGRLKTFKNKLYVGRDMVVLEKEGTGSFRLNHTIASPKNFDARNSIVIPRISSDDNILETYHRKLDEMMNLYEETKFVVYKQQSKITIDFEVVVSEEFDSIINITFLYIFWK